MPLIRRLPKRGFNNARFKTKYAIINLDELELFADGEDVNEESLRAKKLVRGAVDGIKILGRGELTRRLSVQADKISVSAREKIERAGGKIVAKVPAK